MSKPVTALTPAAYTKRLAGLQGVQGATFSDFNIIGGARTWPVHRAVLCAHSEALGTIVSQPAEESKNAEADLSDYPEPCVEALINYLYSFTYDVPPSNKEPFATFHVRMNIIADKYDIVDLKQCAINKFSFELSGFANKALCDDDLATAALRKPLFDSTGRTSPFKAVMLKHAELGFDLTMEMMRKSSSSLAGQKRDSAFGDPISAVKSVKIENGGTASTPSIFSNSAQHSNTGGSLFGGSGQQPPAGSSLFSNSGQQRTAGGSFFFSNPQTARTQEATETPEPTPVAPRKPSATPSGIFGGPGAPGGSEPWLKCDFKLFGQTSLFKDFQEVGAPVLQTTIDHQPMYNGCNEEGFEGQGCKDEELLYSMQKV